MKKILKLSMFLGIISVLVSCTTAPLTGRKQLKLVSDEGIISSSQSQYKQLISAASSKGLLANNTEDGKKVAAVGSRISKAVEQYLNSNGMSDKVKNLNWEFNLIRSNEINAFAMPGGKIAFYTGILPVLKTDAGIAFVMGHEIGHVIGGHHAEGQSNRLLAGGLSTVTSIITGGNGVSSLVNDGLSVTLLKFNRDQEYEADKYGLIFMAMAGYNPEEGIKAEERMAQLTGSNNADFLSTHPRSQKRIEELKKFLPEAMKYYRK